MGSFYFLASKYLITAALVVLISEVVKYTGKFRALIAALPLVTVLVLIWLHVEGQSVGKFRNTRGIRSGMWYQHCLCFCYYRFY
ncbi:MAG: hypothetical protein ACJA1Q_002636 [Pseudohongiellaceae bacterium]|jgi:hypothetical protein